MVGLTRETNVHRFCKRETEILVTCFWDGKNYSQNNFTHNGTTKICKVIHWHICKNVNIPVPENTWKHEPRVVIENWDVMLTYDLMIPSNVNIENKALRPDIILSNKKEKTALLIETSLHTNFG